LACLGSLAALFRACSYRAQELAFYDELLGGSQYGHIERVWWDHYPYACGGLSSCPAGSFPASYQRIIDHVRQISPRTLISNGPDSQWVGNTKGVGAYPIWNYCELDKEVQSKFCAEYSPSGAIYMPRMEGYSIQKSGHWFWHGGGAERGMNATEIWGHWLATVGRGTHWLLNVPPNSSGLVPQPYVDELTAFGSALSATLGAPAGILANISADCGPSADFVTLALPSPAAVDMVQLREGVAAHGQTVARYTLEAYTSAGGWAPLAGVGVHGETIGHRVVDVFAPVSACEKLRWRCTAAGAGAGRTAHLSSFSAHVRHPLLQH
jgi:alpha-L-fucosidase